MRKVIILLAIFAFTLLNAQKKKGIVYFKDNTTVKGFIRVKNFGGIKFKKTLESQAIDYTPNQLKGYDVSGWQFRYIENPETKKTKLYKLILEGQVSLYEKLQNDSNLSYLNNFHNNSAFSFSVKYNQPIYFIRTKKELVKIGKTLKKKYYYIFSDCSSLIKKIEKKQFKKWDLYPIVEYYNEDCI